jgi:hypothetical protein
LLPSVCTHKKLYLKFLVVFNFVKGYHAVVIFWQWPFLLIFYYIAKIQPCCCICLYFITWDKVIVKEEMWKKNLLERAGHSQSSILEKRTCGYGNSLKTIPPWKVFLYPSR